ncbi:uncharacterized protein [Procambarus clarkii]|uniref:uncharacterized protein n=1 Tax=Procambarus clarkii TaxID=6728 RepID=UPI003743AC52
MLTLLVGLGCLMVAAGQQPEFDYVYDYADTPSFQPQPQPQPQPRPQPQPQAVRPPPQQDPRGRRPAGPPPQARPPPRPQNLQAGQSLFPDDSTTPVPILVDSRRIDTKTGAFVYEYAGADGSSKYEFRYPNGTVIGNYTFINDLGEKETRVYSAGVRDPTLIDETTDPNYVDLGNYDLYKHLERPYVHNDGTSAIDGQAFASSVSQVPRPRPSQSAQPRRPPSQPQQRPQFQPAPPQQRPPFHPPQQPAVPLDFGDATDHFSQPPIIAPTFQEANVAPQAPAPLPPPAPVLPSPPRGRPGGRSGGQQQPSHHRLDLSSNQNVGSFLDSVIQRFQ